MRLAAGAIAPNPIWGNQNSPKVPVPLAGNYLDGYHCPNLFPESTPENINVTMSIST